VANQVRSDPSLGAAFHARAQRAKELAATSASAVQPLKFAAILMRAQGATAAVLEELHRQRRFTARFEEDIDRVLPPVLEIARCSAENGPDGLSGVAELRLGEVTDDAVRRLLLMWTGEVRARDDYLSRAMLRPWVEMLRHAGVAPDRLHARGHCPFCGGAPSTSCRRGGSESEGSARFLVCSLCALEWSFNRILCPSCFESEPKHLPVFTNDAYPTARIEACETCGRYVKSIDMSRDLRSVPEIDDVASIAFDLWAVEQGYTRVEPGLAGL
jgi:formate dehydrogenase maturation protein FdhE